MMLQDALTSIDVARFNEVRPLSTDDNEDAKKAFSIMYQLNLLQLWADGEELIDD